MVAKPAERRGGGFLLVLRSVLTRTVWFEGRNRIQLGGDEFALYARGRVRTLVNPHITDPPNRADSGGFGVFCSAGSGRPVARFGKGGGQAFIAGWERVRAILANELPICAEGITVSEPHGLLPGRRNS